MPKNRKTKFYETNTQFAAYIPSTLESWFVDYLQHFCQGESKAQRFIVFLYELRALEQKGITIVNPIKQYESERAAEIKKQFGTSKANEICVRFINFKDKSIQDKDVICSYCKIAHKNEYKACQELKKEINQTLGEK